jgi:lysophospholipase L1-like esterase
MAIVISIISCGISQEEYTIINADLLIPLFKKAQSIENSQKVKILHIGDSHIQGNFFVQATREILQERFGNGGMGFIFPYNLAKTNSTANKFIKFSSNSVWQSCRVSMRSHCHKQIIIGISGHGLLTNDKNFEILLEVPEIYKFDKITIFYPNEKSPFSIENDLRTTNLIGIIAENQYWADFQSAAPMNSVRIFQNEDYSYDDYNLNGIYIENDKSGIIYNSIGINGAKASDFLQNSIFFEQIPAVSPDLIILSFGTNEAFSEISPEIFILQIDTLISKIKEKCGEIPVLVTTPPLTLVKKIETSFINEYSKNLTEGKSYAIWDLHELTHKFSVKDDTNSLLTKDKVHYSKYGYEFIGGYFANALIKNYEYFLTTQSK